MLAYFIHGKLSNIATLLALVCLLIASCNGTRQTGETRPREGKLSDMRAISDQTRYIIDNLTSGDVTASRLSVPIKHIRHKRDDPVTKVVRKTKKKIKKKFLKDKTKIKKIATKLTTKVKNRMKQVQKGMVQSQVILVGGGTGFVGRHLVNLLKGGGAKVRVITRHPGTSRDQISWETIRNKGLPEDTTAVVNLAGRNILDPVLWTDGFKKEVYDSRINTNRWLVDAINGSTNKPQAFVTVSGVGYYQPSEKNEYDEEWQQQPTMEKDYLMRLAHDWEAASKLSDETSDKTRSIIIRAGVVIGSDGGIIKNTKLPFKMGLGGPIGDGKQWFPWIHVDDLANMFKFAITNNHVDGIINGVAPEHVRNRDFASTYANLLGRPSFLPMPAFVVSTIFGSERGSILLKGQRVKSRAGLLGFRYEYPTLRQACLQSIA